MILDLFLMHNTTSKTNYVIYSDCQYVAATSKKFLVQNICQIWKCSKTSTKINSLSYGVRNMGKSQEKYAVASDIKYC